MGSDGVVVAAPLPDLAPSVLKIREPTDVQAFIPEASIEALDIRVLYGLSRFNGCRSNMLLHRPG